MTAQPAAYDPAELLDSADVPAWDDTAEVVVIGFGIAGACAALEARRTGADVLVIERASGGGGASALSAGIFYFGGGTEVQQAAGYEDTPEAMFDFLMACTNAPDARLVRSYCDNSVAQFAWLEAQGVPFKRTHYKGKAVIAPTDDCLASTGNEKVWPYHLVAKPAPRGHKVAWPGDGGGALAMNALIARCEAEGVRTAVDSRVTALVRDGGGRIVGVRVKQSDGIRYFRATRGVIVAAGAFGMNREMLKHYAPHFPDSCVPLGIPHNDGDGIRLGQSAGAALRAMDGIIATASYYPPEQLIKAILVNNRGERFVAEDSYHGRTGQAIMEQPGTVAYLIMDSETFAYPEVSRAQHRLVDGWETIAEMEQGLGVPTGSLERTLAEYNAGAARGEDPLYHKHPDWLQPLDKAPYAAFEVSYSNSYYYYITLGGMTINEHAEVLDDAGQPIPGLFAAGACTSTISQSGRDYASGMMLGPASWFGRVAGRRAAQANA
ncbi:MAG: FAD-dependent oxidoreductase [Sphingomonadales bacterium]|nr:FAD-dependent oxidoreductase [Sphingomonadales bacterium]